MTYNSLLDEKCLTIWRSPAGLRHVGAWFGQVQCGAFVDTHSGWQYDHLTTVRWCARVAQRPKANRMCKRCAKVYEDVDYNA